MPFLQMIQSVESQLLPFPLIQESNFQLLLGLQHQKLMMQPLNAMVVESESCRRENQTPQFDRRASGEGRLSGKRTARTNKERKKRNRSSTRRMKNKDQVESQRMTHIAIERNRRRQMNEHLNALSSLMPTSYVQKGDQASIIGGAIDFVKELEQLLQSLQAQKRMRQSEESDGVSASSSCSSSSSASSLLRNLMTESSPSSASSAFHFRYSGIEESSAETKSGLSEIEVVVIQNHANLKIQCQRRSGQLLKAIVAFENHRLSVLHLSITSLDSSVHYSFNLKMEDNCRLGSAEDVAAAVRQIFTLINGG